MRKILLASMLTVAAGITWAGGAGGGALEMTQHLNFGLLADQVDQMQSQAYTLAQNQIGLSSSDLLTQTSKLLGDSALIGNASAQTAKRLTDIYGNVDVTKATTAASIEQYRKWAQASRQDVRKAMMHNDVVLEQGKSETQALQDIATKLKSGDTTIDAVKMQKMATEINYVVAEKLHKLTQMNAANAKAAQAAEETKAAARSASEQVDKNVRAAKAARKDCTTAEGKKFLLANGYCE